MNPDVTVNISDVGAEVITTDFGLILIVAGDGTEDYKEYDLSSGIANSGISDDYATSTDTYKKALAVASQKPCPGKVAIVGCSGSTGTTLTDKLDGLLAEHGDFFRLLTSISSSADMLAMAKWAETNKKVAYLQYADTSFTEDYTSVGARLLLHKASDEHQDGAEAAYAAVRTPGSFIPKFKELESITPDKLSATEIAAANTKNMGYYIRVAGLDMERSSKASNWSVSKPMYIDDLESRVYTEVTMQNKLLSLMVNTPKLGGDTRGLQLIDATLGQVLERNFIDDIIAIDGEGNGDYTVNTEKAEFVKATREWKGIEFEYTYLHGAEKITVTGGVK